MKRLLHIPLIAAMGLVSGCTIKNTASVVPVGICAPNTDANSCSSAGKCAAFLAGQSFFFLSLASTGTLNSEMAYFMQFDNQLEDNSDASTGRTNTHDAWIDEVALSYTVHPTASTPAFSVPSTTAATFATIIRAQSNGTPFVQLIPPNTIAYLATQIAAGDRVLVDVELKGRGRYLDQTTFETGAIRFPVLVINEAFPGYACPNAGDAVTAICPVEGEGGATFACGKGGGAGLFTIGGTVSGLTSSGLILATPGVSDLTVAAGSTSFVFGTGVPDGTAYDVTVAQQPASQNCTVTGGVGTVSGANVTSVLVSCI